jgi:RNA polymerase sigma-70 factor, ECF subfamily
LNEEELIRAAYPELRSMAARFMRGERDNHTLQPTALVHETLLRLVGGPSDRPLEEFLAMAVHQMRHVLVDYARRHNALKRGGDWIRVPMESVESDLAGESEGILTLHAALERLGERDPRALQVVELRYFGGFTIGETARVMGVAEGTVEAVWRHARLWLYRELAERVD